MKTTTQNQQHLRIRRLTLFAMLLALEVILAFTPLGMIITPVVAITTMHIPVILCGIVMGPLYGSMMGFAFGLLALIRATTAGVSAIDILFSPFLSGSPLASLITCLVPRVLLGLLAALLFRGLSKLLSGKQGLVIGIAAVAATALHTLMVLACLFLFFRAIPLRVVFATILSLNGWLEMLAAALICVPVGMALLRLEKRNR